MDECPKCGAEMLRQECEPDVGIEGGWFCTNEKCDHFVHESEVDWSDDVYPD